VIVLVVSQQDRLSVHTGYTLKHRNLTTIAENQ